MRRHLRAQAIDRVDWHRTQGHRLVIVSASLGVYVRPIAERLRFDAVLATELEVDDDGRLTGRLGARTSAAPRRPAASTRGSADMPAYVWAYGDSSGDRELWARADRPGSDHQTQPVRAGPRVDRMTGRRGRSLR